VDEPVHDGADSVFADQIMVEPQVIDPLAFQLVQQPQGFSAMSGPPVRGAGP
jgi:isocitrate/isopropylmalate dehydrogenase